MSNYFHGNIDRLSLFGFNGRLKRLNIFNIFGLKPDDVIITNRSISPIFEFIKFFYLPRNCPVLLNVSDGVVFPQNTFKKSSKTFTYPFNSKFYDDVLLWNQVNHKYFDQCLSANRFNPVNHRIYTKNVVILLGNDFVFDMDELYVSQYYYALLKSISARFNVCICSKHIPTKTLRKVFSQYKSVNWEIISTSNTIIVGSPSTFLIEKSLEGFPICLADIYDDSFMNNCIPKANAVFGYRSTPVLMTQQNFLTLDDFINQKRRKKEKLRIFPIDFAFLKYFIRDLVILVQAI